MSSCFAFGLAAGDPLKAIAAAKKALAAAPVDTALVLRQKPDAVLTTTLLVACIVGAFLAWRTRSVRAEVVRRTMRLPLLGPLFASIAVARFARMLGTLLENGIPMLQALEIAEAELTGQHHPFTAEFGRHRHAGGAGDRHLRRAMQGQPWRDLGGEQGQADVLNDQGIHAGGLGLQQQLGRRLQLIGKHQDVEGEKPLHAAGMQPGHHLGQILATEVLRP